MVRFALAAVLLAAAAGCAHSGPHAPPSGFPEPAAADPARSEAAFRRLSSLAGSWVGEFGEEGNRMKATVDYRVTSGGTAVEEVLGRGTPHEMVTMYHLDGGRLLLTHYCAAGNQPTMVLLPGDDPAVLPFDFLRGTNMAPGDGHMHQALFEFPGEDRIRAAWTYWKDGQPGPAIVFDFRRAR